MLDDMECLFTSGAIGLSCGGSSCSSIRLKTCPARFADASGEGSGKEGSHNSGVRLGCSCKDCDLCSAETGPPGPVDRIDVARGSGIGGSVARDLTCFFAADSGRSNGGKYDSSSATSRVPRGAPLLMPSRAVDSFRSVAPEIECLSPEGLRGGEVTDTVLCDADGGVCDSGDGVKVAVPSTLWSIETADEFRRMLPIGDGVYIAVAEDVLPDLDRRGDAAATVPVPALRPGDDGLPDVMWKLAREGDAGAMFVGS
jgi:hypothetical protein